jgi:metallophosphoesterase superfamily enzyme
LSNSNVISTATGLVHKTNQYSERVNETTISRLVSQSRSGATFIENNIKDCIILGDVFDRRKYTNHKVIKAIRDILFDPLADYGISVKVLVGNHDSTFKNSIKLNTLDLLLSHYLNVEIIENPIDIAVNTT